MKILLTTFILDERTGAELYTCELAHALQARGHDVIVYAVNPGALAKQAAREGLTVVSDLRHVPTPPDVIHAHHQPALIDALLRFPRSPAVYVVHDAVSPLDAPFPFHRVRRHVAVDERCLGRIRQDAGVAAHERKVILNFVDLARFTQRRTLPAAPRRALLFSNYAKAPSELTAIQAACQTAGLRLDSLGKAAGLVAEAPETMLGDYDIVFAKARAAMEAMATGCAVVLCDFAGLGEMVTPERFDHLRAWNFGAGVLTAPITKQGVAREISRYDPSGAARVRARIRAEASLDGAAEAWLALYGQIIAEPIALDTRQDRRRLVRASRRWKGVRRASWLRLRTRKAKDAANLTGALYRFGRALWRAAGSPGALRQ